VNTSHQFHIALPDCASQLLPAHEKTMERPAKEILASHDKTALQGIV
jgi:hypothetical protein